jgi:hypothetical protein
MFCCMHMVDYAMQWSGALRNSSRCAVVCAYDLLHVLAVQTVASGV